MVGSGLPLDRRSIAGMRRLRRLIVWGACVLLLGGCSSSLRVMDLDTKARRQTFGFLVDGMTTAEEVRSRLGNPHSEFEQSRIVTYRLASPDAGDFKPAAWSPYELVLVFDASQVLKRHALIQRW
jgi:hypothetical protein